MTTGCQWQSRRHNRLRAHTDGSGGTLGSIDTFGTAFAYFRGILCVELHSHILLVGQYRSIPENLICN